MPTTPRGSLPMYFPAAPFALADAVNCAALVDIAYDQYVQWYNQDYPSKGQFVWTTPTNGYTYSAPLFWTTSSWGYDEPFGFVAQNNANLDAYLVFRGTVSDDDWYQDGLASQTPYQIVPGYGQVHEGFYEIYQGLSAQSQIYTAIAGFTGFKRFLFTGHSLGCGLSSLAVPDVITHTSVNPRAITVLHYNLASPRVGDPQYAYMMNNNRVPTYRIVNTEDVVPDAPTAVFFDYLYKHIGTQVDFTAQYDSIGDNHAHDTCYQYALLNPDNPEGPLPSLVARPPGLAPRPGVRVAVVEGRLTRLARPSAEVTATPR
jgi:triacylglycerol lipase